MRVYNTQTRTKEEFVPREPGKVAMYVCGPTVYNHIHIGNARTFLSFDVIRRYLQWRGYQVSFVQNVTDVDDKIIRRATEEGTTPQAVAKKYTKAFVDVMHALGVEDPTVRPQATHEIGGMITLIRKLIDSGHAYATDDGDVYFSVRSYPQYGKLSGRNSDDLEGGHRELAADDEVASRKRDPLDFALWKAAKPGEPSWGSPWGEGRPGWHIECSVMSEKYLGLPLDIHGGGGDLIFPHHENEIAQSEAATGKDFAHYWLHTGMLKVDNEKMSKSLGNFVLLKDILEKYDPSVLRLLSLQTHYRGVLDYSVERMDEAKSSLERIATCVRNARWAVKAAAGGEVPALEDEPEDPQLKALLLEVGSTRTSFIDQMDDDFNTAGALGSIFSLVSDTNAYLASCSGSLTAEQCSVLQAAAETIEELMGVFGVKLELGPDQMPVPPEVVTLAHDVAGYAGEDGQEALKALLEAREAARADKLWGVADAVRDGLSRLGYLIEDTPQGARIIFKEN